MITTGVPFSEARKTEVVDVVTGKTCTDLADFPLANSLPVYGAVGVNLHGTPAVCGGLSKGFLERCYKFTNGGWQYFASMKERRMLAAGVTYNKKFHIFGGFATSNQVKTSELISIDGGVEYGPELPAAVKGHAITPINATVSILSGGQINVTNINQMSPLTWYFNHETQDFTSGPSLIEGREGHGSATCTDKVTKERITIVTGGRDSYSWILESTELLINGQWTFGPPLPKRLENAIMQEIQHDVFLFGGDSFGGYSGNYESAIYQLSCSSSICSWSTINQALKVARFWTVAIPVRDYFCLEDTTLSTTTTTTTTKSIKKIFRKILWPSQII